MYVRYERDPYEPGDYLRVARPGSLLHHDGIYHGDGYVIHLDKGRIGQVEPLSEFAGSGVPEVVSRLGTWKEAQTTLARARSLIGRPYHALFSNCEHLATFAQTGVAFSPTVRGFAAVAAAAGFVWAANRTR